MSDVWDYSQRDDPLVEALRKRAQAKDEEWRKSSPASRFLVGDEADAPMEPTLMEFQQGAEFEPGQTRRPRMFPVTTDAKSGEARLAMPAGLDFMLGGRSAAPRKALTEAMPAQSVAANISKQDHFKPRMDNAPRETYTPPPEHPFDKRMVDLPKKPQQPFELDYPHLEDTITGGRPGAPLDFDMDGMPIPPRAMIAGRRTVGGPDIPLTDGEIDSLIIRLTGSPAIVDDTMRPMGSYDLNGPKAGKVSLNAEIAGTGIGARVKAHELAHAMDLKGQPGMLGRFNPTGIRERDWLEVPKYPSRHERSLDLYERQNKNYVEAGEKRLIYNPSQNGDGKLGRYVDPKGPGPDGMIGVTPKGRGYEGLPSQALEQSAETIRAYMRTPNELKYSYPDLASAVRKTFNGLYPDVHFNAKNQGAGAALAVEMAKDFRRYPAVGEGVQLIDKKTGKPYTGAGPSAEGDAVAKARQAAQRDIDAGNYDPYFDVEKRTDVDPANHPTNVNTRNDIPSRQKTIEDKLAMTTSPGAMGRLEEAYERGREFPNMARWYHMKQLEDEYVKALGPERGRQEFADKFGGSMAATTGGADPRANLLMAMYGNHLKETGKPIPKAGWEMPHPIGGQYAGSNMAQFDKMMVQRGGLIDGGNPKRHDFKYSFLGHADKPVMDKQMTGILTPGLDRPPPGQYGLWQEPVYRLADKKGVDPRDIQDVAWGGFKNIKTKGKYTGQPMISTVNESIERTARITGLSPKDVVELGIVKSQIPMFADALGPAAVAADAEIDRLIQQYGE